MSPDVLLRNVFLHVTRACNLRCSYCYFSAERPMVGELTTSELSSLWPDLVALSPEKVVLTGGEPLMRPDLLELLVELRAADPQRQVRRCLNTNGFLLTPHLARSLVGLVDDVRISIDALEERNDAFRGRGSFAAAVRALELLQAVGFEPVVLVTLSRATLPDLEALLHLLHRLNVTRVHFNSLRPIGRGASTHQLRPSIEELAAASVLVRRMTGRAPSPVDAPHAPAAPPPSAEASDAPARVHCGVGFFLNILPNGDVFPCHVLTDPRFRCGNVREHPLRDLARGGMLERLRTLDFPALAREHAQLADLADRGTCLGDVFDQTRALAVWDELPAHGRETGRDQCCG